MAAEKLSEDQKKEIMEYQSLQQQYQVLAMQRQQLAVALAENKAASEAVAKAKGKVYRFAGSVLVEKDKKALTEELDKEKETLELRSKVFDKQEKQLREKLEAVTKKLQASLGGGEAAVEGG